MLLFLLGNVYGEQQKVTGIEREKNNLASVDGSKERNKTI